MKKVIIIISISVFVFSCSWFLNIDEQFRDLKVNVSGKLEGESITFSSENPDVGETVTITAKLGDGRKVKLSAPGVEISPETIVTDGGTASFVMPKEVVNITADFSDIKSSEKSITGFVFESGKNDALSADITGVINESNHTINLTVPYGTAVTALVPTISLSPDASVEPASGTKQDFSNSVIYKVTAQDGTTQDYTVSVNQAPGGNITVSSNGNVGSESVIANYTKASEGVLITLEAKNLATGRKVELSVPDVTISPSTLTSGGIATFTMPAGDVTVTATFEYVIGAAETVAVGSETLTMHYANDSTDMTFPTGPDDNDGEKTLSTRFWMGETEVTYAQWYQVYQWAENNGYTFQNPGREGSTGTDGAAPTGKSRHPVTMISWRDAVIWCNALSEMTGAEVVYVANGTGSTTDGDILRSSANNAYGDSINVEDVVKSEEDTLAREGYRLPGEWEWEYAARYRGTDDTNTVDGYTDPHFTRGNSASGATEDCNNDEATGAVAWYYNNSGDATHPAGSPEDTNARTANALGLYDMSGNVWEWCFDKYTTSGSSRVWRGGSWMWDYGGDTLQVSYRGANSPACRADDVGFRLCRTAD